MKADLQRLFIAVPIDDIWRKRLTEQCTLLQLNIPFQKWTHPDDYHITLKFLGETSVNQVQQIKKHLANIAKDTRPFVLKENDWGTFGPQIAPSILWAGVGGDLTSLNNLQKKVDSMDEIGFPKENRIFHPHLTIARRYIGIAPMEISEYLPETAESIIHWSVSEIKIFQSHFHKKPMYEPIASFKLN